MVIDGGSEPLGLVKAAPARRWGADVWSGPGRAGDLVSLLATKDTGEIRCAVGVHLGESTEDDRQLQAIVLVDRGAVRMIARLARVVAGEGPGILGVLKRAGHVVTVRGPEVVVLGNGDVAGETRQHDEHVEIGSAHA